VPETAACDYLNRGARAWIKIPRMASDTQPSAAANPDRADGARAPGLLHLRGVDAVKFLQGQLSNDMALLSADRLLLAGLHNPQGRVLALLRLAAPEPDHIIALLPSDLAAVAMATLQRYVLRARVTISNESSAAAIAALAAQRPAVADAVHAGARARDIAAGIPQVYAATSGEFIAQMLNLDCIGAISFSKGCYTGQEIIARSHYRGRVKRRLQRFATAARTTLEPGQSIGLSDGRAAQVVDAVVRADGRTEFLAVAALPAGAADAPGSAAAGSAAAGTPGGASVGAPAAAIECTPLPLPYMLPP
jgi:folate-binding protein YgfZ